MPDIRLRSDTWKYAIVGGIFSIPLSLGDYWLSGTGSNFSTSMVFFGDLLAGYLAKRHSANPARAGIGAGIVGGLPGYLWILPAMMQTATDFATAWSSPLAATVVMTVLAIAVIGIAAVPGLIGGYVGGWLAKKLNSNRAGAVSAL